MGGFKLNLVTGKKISFSKFLEDPLIACSLAVIGLITLVLAILEFSQSLGSR